MIGAILTSVKYYPKGAKNMKTQSYHPNDAEDGKLAASHKRYFVITFNEMRHPQHLVTTEDIAVYLWVYHDLHGIPFVQSYMVKLIDEAANRVYQYRKSIHMLSFSDNERIMLHRLYEVIK